MVIRAAISFLTKKKRYVIDDDPIVAFLNTVTISLIILGVIRDSIDAILH